MAKITQIIALFFCCLQFSCVEAQFRLGAEQTQLYLPFLEAKKVAVVGNQTSMIGNIHLVDSLRIKNDCLFEVKEIGNKKNNSIYHFKNNKRKIINKIR